MYVKFFCLRFSIYNFIDLETCFRIWNTYKIGTYRGVRKTKVTYIEDYTCKHIGLIFVILL